MNPQVIPLVSLPRQRMTCFARRAAARTRGSRPGTERVARAAGPPDHAPATTGRGFIWGAAALIVVAGVAAYSNSFRGPFIFDDPLSIAHNPSIRSLRRLGDVLLPSPQLHLYRPTLNLSLAVCHSIGGLDVVPYHMLNLGIHIVAALVLFGVVRRTLLRPTLAARFGAASTVTALTVSLLWMLHPLQTESVTYVVQRCEALMGLFCLLTVYCVLRSVNAAGAWLWYLAAVAACTLGMGAKEGMAMAPFLVVLYDRTFLAPSWRALFRTRWGLYLALTLTSTILVPMIYVSLTRGSSTFVKSITACEYARTQFGVVVRYLRLSVWPDALCFDYGWPVAQSVREIVPPAVVIGVLFLATCGALWRWPRWGFLGACFWITLAPSSSIFPIQDLAFEHRMYLPLAPLAVAVVLGAYVVGRTLVGRRPSLGPTARLSSLCLVAGTTAVLGILTYVRNDDYRSELRIWQDTVAKAPHNYRAHNNLGRALAHEDRSAEAIVHYQRALEINPDYTETNFNFGLLLVQLGRFGEAIPRLQQVLKIRPHDIEAHLNLGVALAHQGQDDAAIGHYQKVLEIDPRFAPAHNNLGNILLRLGRFDQAVVHYQAAVDIDPSDAEYQHNLDVCLQELGKRQKADVSKAAEK